MRIVLFIDILVGGGAGRSVVTLFETLNKKGIDTHLILVHPIINIPIETFNEKVHILYETALEPSIKLKPIKYFLIAQKLKDKIKDLKPVDLFISNLQFADHVTRIAKIPNSFYCIRSNMSIDFLKFKKNKFTQNLKKWRLKQFYGGKNIITISEGIEKDIVKNLKIRPKFIKTIYNPFNVNKSILLSKERNSIVPNEKYIIHVGRFHIHQKRQDILLRAYKKAAPPYKLLLLGKGDDEKEIKQLVKDLDLEKKIIFAGFHKNPYPFIKNAELLLLTSDYEGFGRVIAEALILGTTVVSTNCPSGPDEILSNDLNDYLAKMGNVDDIAEKITFAINNPMQIEEKHFKFFKDEVIIEEYIKLVKRTN